ncbi:carbamoyltransferase [Candidatus Woesearchaeota archaeon]|nr:carbamoyltransferase [Candidatus Woesearchaeota archaeon]
MRILGISETDNDSGAALLIDGKIAFAANEERFSRVKRHRGFPYETIKWILKSSRLSLDDIDQFVIAKGSKRKEIKSYVGALTSHFMKEKFTVPRSRVLLDQGVWFGRNIPQLIKDTTSLNGEIEKWFKESKIPAEKIHRVDHHPAHAACAYYFSGFEDALVVTCDGQGLGVTASVWEVAHGKFKLISTSRLPDSPGNFYGLVTKVCGFTPNRHEGKITGLAAHGHEVLEVRKCVDEMLFFRNGKIRSNAIYGSYLHVKKLHKRYGRENLSYAFQKRLEEVVTAYINHYWKKRKHLKNIALAGGVFANVRLNQEVMELPGVQQLFVYPHMADGGLCAGAAAMLEPDMKPYRLHDVYLGPGYSTAEMKRALDKFRVKYKRPKNLAKEVARLLAKNFVVGRFDGRMEFGPRALGNRTIMYHTTDPKVNEWLNKNLHRSEFMPFAPVTLKEHASRCYKGFERGEYTSEFMTVTFDCTDEMKRTSPAVVHIDGTARPQVVTKDINPGYYDIVSEYYKLTGIPTVVNTSFNMHEEPIVCSPQDAIRSFKQGNLDALIVGPFLVINPRLRKELRSKK